MFTIGTVVRLRSGGPTMTVVDDGASTCEVTYFHDGGYYTARFPVAALEVVSTPKPVLTFDGKQLRVHCTDGTALDEGALASAKLPLELEVIADAPEAARRLSVAMHSIQVGVRAARATQESGDVVAAK